MPQRIPKTHRQVNWVVPRELHALLKEYQHENRIDSLSEAARKVLLIGLSTEGFAPDQPPAPPK